MIFSLSGPACIPCDISRNSGRRATAAFAFLRPLYLRNSALLVTICFCVVIGAAAQDQTPAFSLLTPIPAAAFIRTSFARVAAGQLLHAPRGICNGPVANRYGLSIQSNVPSWNLQAF